LFPPSGDTREAYRTAVSATVRDQSAETPSGVNPFAAVNISANNVPSQFFSALRTFFPPSCLPTPIDRDRRENEYRHRGPTGRSGAFSGARTA